MRKIFVFMMVSLDGFFEGPDHELDWHNVDAEFNKFAEEQLNEVDTLMFGWKTYELMAGYWPTEAGKQDNPVIAEKMNSLPKIVFSRNERKVEWENTRLITGNVGGEVTKLKNQHGKNIAIFGSSNLCVSLIQMGLIDEFRIIVNPVVLVKGHTLFNGINDKLNLKLMKTRTFNSGNVLLYYQIYPAELSSKGLIAKASISINAPIAKVWGALVNPEKIKQYMFGTNAVSDWKKSSPIVWKGEWEGKKYEDKGVILKLEPGRMIQYSHFSPLSGQPDLPENYHIVTIELSGKGKQTLVSLMQDNNATEETREHSEKNWNMILGGMKKLLEK